MIRPPQCLAIWVFDHIGLRPYWYLEISVSGHIGIWPYRSLAKCQTRSSTKGQRLNCLVVARYCGCKKPSSHLHVGEETEAWLPAKIFGFAGDRTVMIRYLWFDQWLAANRPMIMTNAWVTSREDGLRQATKSWAAFYTRSRCLWPAWATSVFTEIRKQCPANNRQIRFSNGDRIGQNIL